ncbi:MAG: hypothetical protein WC869_00680 [Phycisphaerae bacterium]
MNNALCLGRHAYTKAMADCYDQPTEMRVRSIRQLFADLMDATEQTGIDHALSTALEQFDRTCEQEGINPNV